MSLANSVLDHLNEPENKIALLEVEDVRREYGDVASFRDELNSLEEYAFELGFLPPEEVDDESGNLIILASNKNKNIIENPSGIRIYLVDSISQEEIKDYIFDYRVTRKDV